MVMSKDIKQALGLGFEWLCFGNYLPPPNPAVNYFPFDIPKLPDIQYVGEWDDFIKEFKRIGDDGMKHHYICKKDKNGYLYYYDKITKKRYHDPFFKYKVFEDGMVFREVKR